MFDVYYGEFCGFVFLMFVEYSDKMGVCVIIEVVDDDVMIFYFVCVARVGRVKDVGGKVGGGDCVFWIWCCKCWFLYFLI